MNLTQKSLNYIRAISAEIIMKAKSGHTGIALGASTILFALFKDHLKFDTQKNNINRDRFVLSAGHASALYYTILYTFGFDLSMEDLENFRQINSCTQGHPEYKKINGIEATTGPLGQGVANAVGMAIEASHYAKLFNVQKFQIFDSKIYCFVSDGDLMEGISQESLSLAGNLKLSNLILLYDYNQNTLDGKLSKSNSENIKRKYSAMGFRVIYVKKGNDYKSVTKAIEKAKRTKKQPTIVVFETKIGYGTKREDDFTIHGIPLSEEEFTLYKEKLGITTSMFIPNAVLKFCRQSTKRNEEKFEDWKKNLILYETTHPELHKMLLSFQAEPKIQKDKLYKLFEKDEEISGRDANKRLLNEICAKIPNIIGGSADLASSTKAYIEKGKDFTSEDYAGRNISFGVREHAMVGVSNGISLFAFTRVFCSTFLVFSQYCIPAIRMSAMMSLPVWYFFTHDSFHIGEDGATHQPVEQLAQLRLIPNLTVYRPCDCLELTGCYLHALQNKSPSCFVLSRQNLPVVSRKQESKVAYGAYVISASKSKPKISFFATGSEVLMCLQAQKLLEKENISVEVVSVPCYSLFKKQKSQFKTSILKNADTIIAVEASNDPIWFEITKNVFQIDRFGEGGKDEDVTKELSFSVKNLVKYAKTTLKSE